MIQYFMGMDLLREEKVSISDFLDSFGRNKSSSYSGKFSRAIFEQIFITDFTNRSS